MHARTHTHIQHTQHTQHTQAPFLCREGPACEQRLNFNDFALVVSVGRGSQGALNRAQVAMALLLKAGLVSQNEAADIFIQLSTVKTQL